MQHILIIDKHQSWAVSQVVVFKRRWNIQMDAGKRIQQRKINKSKQLIKTEEMHDNPSMQFFRNQLVFPTISQFLTVKEVLELATVNQQLRSVVEQYCRSKLVELNLKPSVQKSSMHLMQFYFNRCLKITRQDDKNILAHRLSIHHPFKFETIHHFEVGTTFTSYLTRDQKARIFRTVALLKSYESAIQEKKGKNKMDPLAYECFDNIKDVKSKSDQCVLLKVNGEVSLLSGNKNDEQLITMSEPVIWTSRIPVTAIYNSFAYSIFYPSIYNDPVILLAEIFNKKWPYEMKEKNACYLVGRNMLNNKQFIIQLPCGEVVEVAVGGRFAYFISDKNELMEADLQDKMEGSLAVIKANILQSFMGKTIAKVVSGFNYFLALERTIQQIQQWDTETVLEWLKHIGFEAYVKIATAEKLNGKKLKNIDKRYMHDALGITTQNMQQKLMMSIDEIVHRKSNNDQLWGWGRNDNGQLGSSSANFVTKPQKVRLNFIREGEYVDSIFCGWFQTFIRTQKGRIYCTKIKKEKKRKGSQHDKQDRQEQEYEIIEQKKQERQMMGSEEQLQDEVQTMEKGSRKKSNRAKQQKKRKKGAEQKNLSLKQRQKENNNKKYEEQESWEQFSQGKAFFIQTYKDTIFIIQCPDQSKEQPNKVKKLRTAKAILDKILWSSVNKQEFKVGYLDKEVGLIEESALDLQKYDFKQNRIKYFKRNNVIVWDRENKIDMF